MASTLTEDNLKVEFHGMDSGVNQLKIVPDLTLLLKFSEEEKKIVNPLIQNMFKLKPFHSFVYERRSIILLRLDYWCLKKVYLLDEIHSRVYEAIGIKEFEERHPNSVF